MIIDQLKNSRLYEVLSPGIKRAFEYICNTDLQKIEVGRYDINGKTMFALIQQYATKQEELGIWEAHRRYIDLQYMIRGTEKIRFAPISRLIQGEYDLSKDFLALSGSGDILRFASGEFMVLFPEDGHMPGIIDNHSCLIKKIVVKIAVE
jgi:YhcH/YjgK/YiaL family protein